MKEMKKYKVQTESIIHAGTDEQPYYTNSSQLPVGFTTDAFEALDLQDDLQKMYTGGCIEGGNYVEVMAKSKPDCSSKASYPSEPREISKLVKWFNEEKDNLDFYVTSYDNERNIITVDKIVDAMSIDVSKHDKIRVKCGDDINLVTSDWHPFFIREDGKVIERRADELKEGDILIGMNTKQFLFKGIIKSEDYIVTSVSKVDVEDNQFYDLTTEKYHNYLCGSKVENECYRSIMKAVFIHNTVLHLYMNERLSSPEAARQLVKKVLTNYRLPYISITPSFSTCPIHGYIKGHHDYCPRCDRELMNAHADEIDFNA